MAHVQVRAPHPDGGVAQIIIDGEDMSAYFLAEPFDISIGDTPSGVLPSVTLALAVDDLEIDLPGPIANVVAVSSEGEVL